jgi:proteasome lid subunit RPN8/RPN11
MKIYVNPEVFEEILSHCLKCFPLEACGLIAGSQDGDVKVVEKAYPLANLDSSQTHFTIDLKDQLSSIVDMRKKGLTPLGNFHSHPQTPARPSEEDLRLSPDPKASYFIVSFAGQEPIVKSFNVKTIDGNPQSTEEEILIEPFSLKDKETSSSE